MNDPIDRLLTEGLRHRARHADTAGRGFGEVRRRVRHRRQRQMALSLLPAAAAMGWVFTRPQAGDPLQPAGGTAVDPCDFSGTVPGWVGTTVPWQSTTSIEDPGVWGPDGSWSPSPTTATFVATAGSDVGTIDSTVWLEPAGTTTSNFTTGPVVTDENGNPATTVPFPVVTDEFGNALPTTSLGSSPSDAPVGTIPPTTTCRSDSDGFGNWMPTTSVGLIGTTTSSTVPILDLASPTTGYRYFVRYAVQEGDYLVGIADRYGTVADDIIWLNQWGDGSMHRLFPDDLILVPTNLDGPDRMLLETIAVPQPAP